MGDDYVPPMPRARPENAGILTRLRLAREDIFSTSPKKLYSAWMAEQRAVYFKSYTIMQPSLIKLMLEGRPEDFPKSNILGDTLRLLLGHSVFVTNGAEWERQRRIVDPAFEGGRVREVFPAMVEAANGSVARLAEVADGRPHEIEFETAHVAADVIFRTLFSMPITDDRAARVFYGFREYGATAPLVTVLALLKAPPWMPRFRGRASHAAASKIRGAFLDIVEERQRQIADGTAPDDLGTKIMTTVDPKTGERFGTTEMVDHVGVFFLAGHESSAAVLAWALYLLAAQPAVQERAAAEAEAAWGEDGPAFGDMRKLAYIRDVFREALRLYPPVPMLIREAARDEEFRKRQVAKGSLCMVSTWHVHRHERIWDRPHVFDPDRWKTEETRRCARDAYLPFSSGPRVCTGAAFAMVEGVILLAALLRAYRFETVPDRTPVPVQTLTVRSKDGIWLRLTPRRMGASHPS